MRVLRSRMIVGVVLSLSVAGLAACGSSSSGGTSGDIVLGEIVTTSGQYGATGELVEQGVNLAVEQINAAGGINGRKITVEQVDDAGDEATAVAQFKKMASDKKVMAIIGPNLSINAIATTPLTNQFKVVSISPTGQGQWPVDMGDWFFRFPPTNTIQNQSLVDQVAAANKFQKVAIISASDQTVSQSDAADYAKMLPAAGFDVVANLQFKSTDSDYSAVLTSLKKSGAQAVFFSVISAGGPLMAQAQSLGITNVQWVGSTSLTLPDTIKLGGAAAEGMIGPALYYSGSTTPEAQAFTQAFNAKYGSDASANSAMSYDVVEMLANAMKSATGDLTRQSLRDALGAESYTGVTGPASFPNGSGDAKRGDIPIVQVKDGKFVAWQP